MTLKAIIVEDERASRETLHSYLEKYCADVEVLEMADSVKTGVIAIREHKPDLVFLDVEMPYGNAFDLLEEIGEINFQTIFVTAYSHYAIKALNYSASYYLLKPIDIEELIAAVDKVKQNIESGEHQLHTRILIDNLRTLNRQNKKVVLPVLDGFEVVEVHEIIRCQ
ncbi:MAG: response regulator, partial [Bacteroidota bacterium]